MKCPNCSKEVNSEASHCISCGVSLHQTTKEVQDDPSYHKPTVGFDTLRNSEEHSKETAVLESWIEDGEKPSLQNQPTTEISSFQSDTLKSEGKGFALRKLAEEKAKRAKPETAHNTAETPSPKIQDFQQKKTANMSPTEVVNAWKEILNDPAENGNDSKKKK